MTSLSSLQPIELKLFECKRRKSSIAFNKNGYTNCLQHWDHCSVVVEYHKMKKVTGVRTKEFLIWIPFQICTSVPQLIESHIQDAYGLGTDLIFAWIPSWGCMDEKWVSKAWLFWKFLAFFFYLYLEEVKSLLVLHFVTVSSMRLSHCSSSLKGGKWNNVDDWSPLNLYFGAHFSGLMFIPILIYVIKLRGRRRKSEIYLDLIQRITTFNLSHVIRTWLKNFDNLIKKNSCI